MVYNLLNINLKGCDKMGKRKLIVLSILIITITVLLSATVYAGGLKANNYSGLESIILSRLNSISPDFNISYSGSIEELDKIMNNILEKAPYLKCTVSSLEWTTTTVSEKNYNINVKANYIMTVTERNEADEKIDTIISDIIKPYMTDHEKVKAVHDYIVLNGKYDTAFENYSDYDLLTKGTAVCNGYALLTHNMLSKLNIPVKFVFGSGKSDFHVWNLVKVGDHWFHLDTTWNDPLPDKQNLVSYGYYLLTDKEILKDHYIDKNQNLPEANYGYYNYLTSLSASYDGYIYKRILAETGLDVYSAENTADSLNSLKAILQKKIKYYPSVIRVRLKSSLPNDDINSAMSDLFKINSISEISYDNIENDKAEDYNILNLYIKYKETPDSITTDLSDKIYNTETKVSFNVYAVYGTKKENITKDVLIYPYNTNFININGSSLTFNDAGRQDLIFEYKGKKLSAGISAISPKGFNYITEKPVSNKVNVKVFDKFIDFDVIDQWPFIENGRTLVPLRAVFEILNCSVSWDAASSTATVEHGNTKIVIPANSKNVYVNDILKTLDVPAKVVNGRIMVPLRFITESINKTVLWDNTSSTVLIY